MIFRLSAPYQYLLENVGFCFHLSLNYLLLTSKIVTKKKTKHSKEKKYFVKFNDSLCNKFKFIQKAAKGEGSVLYMEEKMISIDTPQSIRYMWMLHNKKWN